MRGQNKKKHRSGFRFYVVLLAFCSETIFIVLFITLLSCIPFFNEYFWIPLLIYIIVNSLNAIFIISTNVGVGFKISWLASCIIFPVSGLVLYWMYADKVTTKRMKKIRFKAINSELGKGLIVDSEALEDLKNKDLFAYNLSNYILKNAYASPYKNSKISYYSLGDYAAEPILNELRKAKKFIFVEYFIIESGEFFDSIYEILKEKASQGLNVRLLYDDFGSVFKVNRNFFRKAKKDNIKCIPFNRIRPIVDIRQNNRDHRKMIIIDGVVAFTGGMNLADEYLNKIKRFGLWKDNCLKVEGKAVNGFTNLFLSNWKFVTKENINHLEYNYDTNKNLRDPIVFDDCYIQPFGDIPFDNEETAHSLLVKLIYNAKKSIYISTPYLVPDDEILNALISASKSGVDVRIVTPGIPDKKMTYSLTRSFYAKLLFFGVKIYEFTPGFNHTKLYVFDDDFALTGTTNLDYRSLYLHFENCLFIYGNSRVFELKQDLLDMFKTSELVDKSMYLNVSVLKKIWWGVLRIFAPLF